MRLVKELPELIEAGVITRDTADRIQDYYQNQGGSSTNRLFFAFGLLGAILVGLGIILIIAHNWDQLSRATKTFFAFLPLIIGQIICAFVLVKRPENMVWREASAAFLFFSVGACISLISQIYNIPGNLSSFLLTWMALCLPLIYLMKSSITSLLYLTGITFYAVETGYWSSPSAEPYPYWLLLALALPHYYYLIRKKPHSNFTVFHHWIAPLSVIIVLGTLANGLEEFMYLSYFSLFGSFYLIGEGDWFSKQKLRNNGYKILGSLGTIVLLLSLSFNWLWEDLRNKDLQFIDVITAPEFWAAVIISLIAAGLLYRQQIGKSLYDIKPLAPVFILFIVAFALGWISPLAVVLINLYVFAIGIGITREGANRDHLGILNYGLLIITALVICRFFDTDLSFVLRGILFVSVGAGFFAANYWILKKRKSYE